VNANVGYALYGNPDLEPEASISSTIGATWAPSSVFSLDAEVYRNDVRDMIEVRYNGVNAAGLQEYRYVNVSDARTSGIEASVRTTLGAFSVAAGYDFVRARDLSNNLPLSKRASQTARLQLAREWNVLSGLQTDLSARYTGPAPLVGNAGTGGTYTGGGIEIVGEQTPTVVARQQAFLSVDMQVRFAVTRFSELSAGVNNLLGAQPDFWTPAYQRQGYMAIRLRYGSNGVD
jgi:outer membrane receptor for ferrienterochelin and colicin